MIICLSSPPPKEKHPWFFMWQVNIMPYCSAVLAYIILREKLHVFGVLGCALCVVGSTTIVLHAPQERPIESVAEVWDLATEPGNCFLKWSMLSILTYLIMILNSVFCSSLFFRVHSFDIFPFCSFCPICGTGVNSCFYNSVPLYPIIWPDTHNVLYWSMLTSGLFVGMYH